MRRIRPERSGDEWAIGALHEAAFGGEWEAALVGRLRRAGAIALALVAEVDGEIVGHLAFSPLPIVADAGEIPAVALAPLAVLPERQRRGIAERRRPRGTGASSIGPTTTRLVDRSSFGRPRPAYDTPEQHPPLARS
jgi:predicted N-acetyltransferase YhbS